MPEVIKRIFFAMNGAFLPKDGYIDESLQEFQDHIYSDLEMSHPIEDRINMKQDVNNVKSDFKKSVKKYKEEQFVNG
ncbi:MAG: hypothetical protein JXR03_02945 [Cyclobacteriaceae bacterium]